MNRVDFVIVQDRLDSVEHPRLHLPFVSLTCMIGTAELQGTAAVSQSDLAWC